MFRLLGRRVHSRRIRGLVGATVRSHRGRGAVGLDSTPDRRRDCRGHAGLRGDDSRRARSARVARVAACNAPDSRGYIIASTTFSRTERPSEIVTPTDHDSGCSSARTALTCHDRSRVRCDSA
jgi:hypothetical protein